MTRSTPSLDRRRTDSTALTRRLENADPAASTAADLAVLDQRARADLAATLATPRRDAAEPSGAGSSHTRRRPTRTHRLLAVAAAACAVALAGAGTALAPYVVGDSSTRLSAADIAPYEVSQADASAVAQMPSMSSAIGTSGPGSWPRLAAESDLVAIGRLNRLQEGRTNTVHGETAWTTTVAVLDDVRAVQGALPRDFDGRLYVELPVLTGLTDLQMWQESALPVGTPVLVYLRPAWDGTDEPGELPYTNRLPDPAQGRPVGQALYEAYYSSSFIVQAADGVIAWPAMRYSEPGTLADVVPNGSHGWPDWNR